jgi:hypothetical protein
VVGAAVLKIKIFTGEDVRTLETMVNRFISKKQVIAIRQSESVDRNNQWRLTITVLYDDCYSYDYIDETFFNNSSV